MKPAPRPLSRLPLLLASALLPMAAMADAGAPYRIAGGGFAYEIDRRTGAIRRGVQGDQAFLDASVDHYALLQSMKEIAAETDETHDQVVDAPAEPQSPDAVRLQCRNDALGVTIAKHYRVDEKTGHLHKRTEIEPREGARGFFVLESGVSVSAGWWRGGIVWDVVWHTGLDSYYPTRTIREELDLAPANGQRSVLMLYHPVHAATLVHYRWGGEAFEFFESISEVQPFGKKVRPRRWRVVTEAGPIGGAGGGALVNETVYGIQPGPPLAFLQAYAQHPGFRALGTDQLAEAPPWLGETMVDMAIDLMGRWGGTGADNWAEQVAPVINRKYHFGMFQVHLWGVWPTEDYIAKPEQAESASMCDPVAITETIARLKASSPRVKVGTYSHFGSSGHYHGNALAKRAIEEGWAVRDPEGKVIMSRADYDMSADVAVHMVRSSPQFQDYWKKRWVEIIENFDTDFMYLDTAVTTGSLRYGLDWPTLRYTDGATVQNFYRDLLDLAIERDNPVFMNYPTPVGNSCGYSEFYFVVDDKRHWRLPRGRLAVHQALSPADHRLYICGNWQYFTGSPAEPSMRLHLNLCHTHGLGVSLLSMQTRPTGEPRSYRNFATFLAKGAPYIQGLFELRNRELVDARVTPDFWALEGESEALAWRATDGDYGLVTVCNHAPDSVTETISFDTRPLGAHPDEAMFVWRLEMADPRTVDFAEVTPESPIRRLATQALLRVEDRPPERLSLELALPSDNPVTAFVTRCPALVTSVDGNPCQYWLPSAYGVRAGGALDPASGVSDVVVDSKADKAEVLVAAPHNKKDRLSVVQFRWGKALPGAGVAVGPEAIDYEPLTLGGRLFIKAAIEKGRTQITVR